MRSKKCGISIFFWWFIVLREIRGIAWFMGWRNGRFSPQNIFSQVSTSLQSAKIISFNIRRLSNCVRYLLKIRIRKKLPRVERNIIYVFFFFFFIFPGRFYVFKDKLFKFKFCSFEKYLLKNLSLFVGSNLIFPYFKTQLQWYATKDDSRDSTIELFRIKTSLPSW